MTDRVQREASKGSANGSKAAARRRRCFLLPLVLFSLAAAAAEDRQSVCEENWKQAYAASATTGGAHDYVALLNSWKALEGQCKGSGVYEFRLATLYIANNQPKLALELLNSAQAWPLPYARLAPLVRLKTQMAVYVAEKPVSIEKIRSMKPQYMAIAAQEPDSPAVNEQVANFLLIVGDDREAIAYAEKSLKLQNDQWEPNRTLTIADYHIGEYAFAVMAGRRAQELRNSLVKDPEFMYAVAKSYAGVGNITVAKMTLAILNEQVPAEHGGPDWQDAVSFIRAQIAAGNQKN